MTIGPARAQVLKYVEAAGTVLAVPDVADALGLAVGLTGMYLRSLHRLGLVDRMRGLHEGRWRMLYRARAGRPAVVVGRTPVGIVERATRRCRGCGVTRSRAEFEGTRRVCMTCRRGLVGQLEILRECHGSWRAVADALDVEPVCIWRYRRGIVYYPSEEMRQSIVDALDAVGDAVDNPRPWTTAAAQS